MAYEELRAELVTRAEALAQRVARIGSDRRGVSAPPERDSEERATQRENDEVLDALDEAGRQELADVRAAIERIDAGAYGTCAQCGESIPEARLRALPAALLCVGCSE